MQLSVSRLRRSAPVASGALAALAQRASPVAGLPRGAGAIGSRPLMSLAGPRGVVGRAATLHGGATSPRMQPPFLARATGSGPPGPFASRRGASPSGLHTMTPSAGDGIGTRASMDRRQWDSRAAHSAASPARRLQRDDDPAVAIEAPTRAMTTAASLFASAPLPPAPPPHRPARNGPWSPADDAAVRDALSDASRLTRLARKIGNASTVLLGRPVEELEALAVSLDVPAYRGRQLFEGLLRGAFSIDEIATLPAGFRAALLERGVVSGRSIDHASSVAADGTVKLLRRLSDGLVVEAVGIPGRLARHGRDGAGEGGCEDDDDDDGHSAIGGRGDAGSPRAGARRAGGTWIDGDAGRDDGRRRDSERGGVAAGGRRGGRWGGGAEDGPFEVRRASSGRRRGGRVLNDGASFARPGARAAPGRGGAPGPASRGSGSLTVCVSSQVGCPMRCSFCATGRGGFSRSLTPAEILDQVLAVGARFPDRRVSNVVFMGMGEPCLNLPGVLAAARSLTRDLGLGARRITVSTVGIPGTIPRLARESSGQQLTLAVSLHAPTQRLRERLVPGAKAYPLEALMSDAAAYCEHTGRRVTFEYTLLAGINDDPEEHADALALLLRRFRATRGLLAHVNLIPWNPTEGAPEDHKEPSPAAVERFRLALERARVPVSVRVTRGREAAAACGQLRNDHQARPFDGGGGGGEEDGAREGRQRGGGATMRESVEDGAREG